MMAPVLLALSMLGQARDEKPSVLIPLLTSADRMKRHEAAVSLAQMPKVPEDALEAIAGYLKLEVMQAMVPDKRADKEGGKPMARLPMVGDEITLPRIKADPAAYVDSVFVLGGAIEMSDSYSWGFVDAKNEYYSFRLSVATKNGDFGDSATLYMRRFDGAALAEKIARAQERQDGAVLAIRLRCLIRRERLDHDLSAATNSIEIVDWQMLDDEGKTWTPWTFEAVGLGYMLMSKVGKAATSTCLAIVLDEQEFQNPKADALLKGTAISHLLKLPIKDQRLIFKQSTVREKQAKSVTAKNWARRLLRSLDTGRIVM